MFNYTWSVIDVYRNDLSKIDIKRYKAIKYYSDTSEKINSYIKKINWSILSIESPFKFDKLTFFIK